MSNTTLGSFQKLLKNCLNYKVIIVVIFLFLIQYLLLKGTFEMYRFTNQEYIYSNGKAISKGLTYIAFILSFLYPLIVWFQRKKSLKKAFVWGAFGFLPALYYIVLYLATILY